jgi:hypothetical protein
LRNACDIRRACKARKRITHLTVEFRTRHQRSHRINYDHVDTIRANKSLSDLKRLLTRIGLRDKQVVDIHTELSCIVRVHRVFGINVCANAALSLGRRNHLESERRLARAFRAVDLNYPPTWQAAHTDGRI